MYFNCKTTLVDDFKEIYSDTFRFGGNRSLIFYEDDIIPVDDAPAREQSGCKCTGSRAITVPPMKNGVVLPAISAIKAVNNAPAHEHSAQEQSRCRRLIMA